MDDLVIDLARRSVLRDDAEIPLAPLTFDLLAVLMRHAPATVTLRTLMDEVWPDLVVGADTVSQRVRLLRAALGDEAAKPRYIASVRGRGYRLVARVEALAGVAGTGHSASPPAAPSRAPRRAAAVAGATVLVLAVGTIAVVAWLQQRAPAAPPPAPITRSAEAFDHYQKAMIALPAAFSMGSTDATLLEVEISLSHALRLDPAFAAAHAQRMAVRVLRFTVNAPGGIEGLDAALQDLEAAERLAPADPSVMAARAMYLIHVESDFDTALAHLRAAEAAGPLDPLWLREKGAALQALGRGEEAAQVYERCIAADPRNIALIALYASALEALQRPLDALRAFDRGIEAVPQHAAILQLARADLLARHTGDSAPLASLVHQYGLDAPPAAGVGVDAGQVMFRAFQLHRRTGSFQEILHATDATAMNEVRAMVPGAGQFPVAFYRGWARLLLGDREGAAAEGREVLGFLDGAAVTVWNRDLRNMLAASARAFTGDSGMAIAAAREVLRSEPPFQSGLFMQMHAAAALAWTGDPAEATTALERLSAQVGPAEIARDPLFVVPLGDNEGFMRLAARLQRRMEAVRAGVSRSYLLTPMSAVKAKGR